MLDNLSEKKKTWKLLELLNWTSQYLSERGFENSRLNVELLLAHVLGYNRIDLYLNAEKPLIPSELSGFKALLKRRLRREPLQYILGRTEFMSLPFTINSTILIPRPETEILVESVIAEAKTRFQESEHIACLDIGTGSGNVAVALAIYLPGLNITAIDITAEGLALAQENARLNNVMDRIRFQLLDFFASDLRTRLTEKFQIVVSNPPYIATEEILSLPPEVRDFEPRLALDGGADGLKFYRKIATELKNLLHSDGFAAFEIGYQQAQAIQTLFKHHGLGPTRVLKDLTGKDRIILVNAS